MSDGGTNALPSWADQMRALEGVSDHLIAKWRRTAPPSPRPRT